MNRLDPQPEEVIDRSRLVSFLFESRTVEAHPGDTIGSALSASGINIFSRSFKYHRPRGLFCTTGKCPNCLMNVNGVPNVRACAEPVRPGDRVKSQHCWPSLRWDALSLIEKFDFLLPVGFYYKSLIRPRFLWKLAEPLLRRLAGLGNLSHRREESPKYLHEYLYTSVAVVGGGPAGDRGRDRRSGGWRGGPAHRRPTQVGRTPPGSSTLFAGSFFRTDKTRI